MNETSLLTRTVQLLVPQPCFDTFFKEHDFFNGEEKYNFEIIVQIYIYFPTSWHGIILIFITETLIYLLLKSSIIFLKNLGI